MKTRFSEDNGYILFAKEIPVKQREKYMFVNKTGIRSCHHKLMHRLFEIYFTCHILWLLFFSILGMMPWKLELLLPINNGNIQQKRSMMGDLWSDDKVSKHRETLDHPLSKRAPPSLRSWVIFHCICDNFIAKHFVWLQMLLFWYGISLLKMLVMYFSSSHIFVQCRKVSCYCGHQGTVVYCRVCYFSFGDLQVQLFLVL